jgi:hypothetical protein
LSLQVIPLRLHRSHLPHRLVDFFTHFAHLREQRLLVGLLRALELADLIL